MGQILREEIFKPLEKVTATTLKLPSGSIVNAGGQQFILEADLICDVTVSGIGGLDTGAIASNSLYYVYGINNNGVLALVASLSALLPTGFSAYRKVGAFHTKDLTTDIHKAFYFGEINIGQYGVAVDASGGAVPPVVLSYSPFNWLDAVPTTYNSTGDYSFNHSEQDIFSVPPLMTGEGSGPLIRVDATVSPTTTESIINSQNAAGTPVNTAQYIAILLTKQGIDAVQPDWSF